MTGTNTSPRVKWQHATDAGVEAGATGASLASLATTKNTFLDFGTPNKPEALARQRSKTLPVVPNMKELLQGSLMKGVIEGSSPLEDNESLESGEHRGGFGLASPDRMPRTESTSTVSPACGPGDRASTDQLIAMQLLATLQAQQMHQGAPSTQFGLGAVPTSGERRRSDIRVDSDDELCSSDAGSSDDEDMIGGHDPRLVDLDKEIDISPRVPRSRATTSHTQHSQGSVGVVHQGLSGDSEDAGKTTVMLRNIPNKYTQKILLNAIDGRGFEGTYDFFYLPIDFRNRCNLGYAFINFLAHQSAFSFMQSFNGYSLPAFKSTKVCEVCWARVQGLDANVEHYRNSPVNEMPHNEYKPMIFMQGRPVDFPRPLSADGGDHKPVVHQTPQHTGGGILQPPPQMTSVNQAVHDASQSPSAGPAVIRRNKIFIGGLSVTSTSDAIRAHFCKWGRVTEAAVITDKKTGQSRGFGFCTYAHDVPDEVLVAEHWVDGRSIGVRIYASGPPTSAPAASSPIMNYSHPAVMPTHSPPHSAMNAQQYLSLLLQNQHQQPLLNSPA